MWQEKIINRFKRNPTRVEELLSYARTSPDGAETLIKAVQLAPDSLEFLLPQLWREQVAGVTWEEILDNTLRSRPTPDRVIEILKLIDNSTPPSRSPVPSTRTAQSQTRGQDAYDAVPKNSAPIAE